MLQILQVIFFISLGFFVVVLFIRFTLAIVRKVKNRKYEVDSDPEE